MTGTTVSAFMTRFENNRARHACGSGRLRHPAIKAFQGMLLVLLLCIPLMAQAGKGPASAVPAVQAKKQAEAPIKYADTQYRSGGRRDPFFNPLLFKKPDKQPEDEEISRGVPPPGIAGTYIAQATLQGISMRDDTKLAIMRGADSRAYFLKTGDKLFDGYLKEIKSDSVTLVRETRLRSGKVLTQDVTKRLRTP